MLHIGILMSSNSEQSLVEKHGSYSEILMQFMCKSEESAHFTVYDVCKGNFPKNINECDAWLISGSANSVNDDITWIKDLEKFCLSAKGKVKLIGICFGHQMIAKAYGGTVERFKGGWCLGANNFTFNDKASYLAQGQSLEQRVCAVNQDQVIKKPDIAELIFTGEKCQNAGFEYGDWGLSFQCHPEFSESFTSDLLDSMLSEGSILGSERKEVKQSMKKQGCKQDLSEYIKCFLDKPIARL